MATPEYQPAEAILDALPTPVTRRRRLPILVGFSLLLLAFVAFCAIFRGLVAPNATTQNILIGVVPPGTSGHLLGTDNLGRDVLQLTLGGTRSAITGPIVIAIGSLLLGILLGAPAGYFGGFLDTLTARWADLLLALPAVLLAMVVAGIIGGGYWITVALLIVLFSPSDIRLIRGGVLEQKSRPYVEAARVIGLRKPRIIYRQILPNVFPIMAANFMLNIVYALVAMSSLSYLGLGVGPGSPDWGRQLADGQALLSSNAAACLAPGVMIVLTASAINIVGDWLQERLEQRTASR